MMLVHENLEFSIFQTAFKHEKKVLGKIPSEKDCAKLEAAQPISNRIGILATRAWVHDLLTEGQLSERLGLHRIPLRTIFYENQSEEGKSDDILKFPVR